jgi:capsular polysaccharide biosynthesis protein
MKYIKMMARAIGLKVVYSKLRDILLKLRGFNLLNVDQTTAFMAPYEVKAIPGTSAWLPQVVNCGDDQINIFPKKESTTDNVYAWEYQGTGKNAQLSKYGAVIVEQKVLCTDWNYSSFYKDIWKKDERVIRSSPVVVALFSQFQDGIFYGGYYDFVFLVLTKLCRIKDALPLLDLSDIVISYPLFNAPYETEYMRLLGVNSANLTDSTKYKVVAPHLITANSAHWYPNMADLMSLKQHIAAAFQPVESQRNRIYISRSGRRCITNEDELMTLLQKYDFLIIADKPRTVTEQISMYYNASFIIGPHGASFSNIIWCQPGAHLFELFSPNYAPDFFLYLAAMMGMEYSAYYEGVADSAIDYTVGLVEDIHVSIPKLDACLNNIFKDTAN